MDNSIYKKCTECGQTKHISEFSKSYPNRCKTCVAEHTRQMRAAEKLKAKVKATGEVIDVEPSGTMLVSCGSFITKDGRKIPGTALEFEKAIDWEQRRYELAKSVALRAFKKGADWQAKQSPWISVEEQLPKEGQKVFVLVMCYGTPCIREEKFCRNSNLDKKGMWIHGNSIVLAWFPIPSFEGILEANKDVLERIKEKGD